MKEKPSTCADCPAFRAGTSFVPGRGPSDARLAIIGQGPGEQEAWSGRPFVGPSGQMLDSWLHRARINPLSVYFNNIVQCWLPENRKPTVAESTYCYKAHVYPALAALPKLEVLVPCGVHSMKHFLGAKTSARAAGTQTTMKLRRP